MKNKLLLTLIVAAAVLVPQAAFSQDVATEEGESVADGPPEPEPVFGAGDIDGLVNVGFNLLYLNVEPALDIGIVGFAGDMALSVGGGFGYGYCVLCGLVSAFSEGNISASNYAPYGRINLHLGTIGGLLNPSMGGTTLDPVAGLMGGANLYRFKIDFDSSDAEVAGTGSAIFAGPVFGLRLGFADNLFLLFAEYRFLAEFGFNAVTLDDGQGNSFTVTDEAYGQRNSSLVFGFGIRI